MKNFFENFSNIIDCNDHYTNTYYYDYNSDNNSDNSDNHIDNSDNHSDTSGCYKKFGFNIMDEILEYENEVDELKYYRENEGETLYCVEFEELKRKIIYFFSKKTQN
jgi:hypothetical protein